MSNNKGSGMKTEITFEHAAIGLLLGLLGMLGLLLGMLGN